MALTGLRHSAHQVRPATRVNELAVVVRGGYQPEVLHARRDLPVRIAFLREESAACSEQVVFPAFGKSATLPQGKTTVVELPACSPGTYHFTCAMNILHGQLVVD